MSRVRFCSPGFDRISKRLSPFFFLFTDDAIEVVLAETTNANLLTPLAPLPTAPPRVARTTRQLHRSRDAQPEELPVPQRSVPAPRGLEIANLKR